MKDLSDTVRHCCNNQLHGLGEGNICQFIRHQHEQFPKGSGVRRFSLFQCQQHIAHQHDGRMGGQGVIGQTVALGQQFEIGLTGLEKHLYVPTIAIQPDDLFFG